MKVIYHKLGKYLIVNKWIVTKNLKNKIIKK